MRSVRAAWHDCDHDQSERVSSEVVGAKLEKLLQTDFIINTENYILEQIFAERLVLVEHTCEMPGLQLLPFLSY